MSAQVTMGVTTFINTNYNFFGDPVMPVIVRPRRRISPSRRRRASSPGEGVGGRFFSDFEGSSRDSVRSGSLKDPRPPIFIIDGAESY